MEIWHRITFGHHDNVDAVIEAMNIQHKTSPLTGDGYLIHIDVSESSPSWPQLAALVQQKKALDVVETIFTLGEILDADWIRLIPTFEQGYPQPEETWVKNPINYEDHCAECGVFRQTTSFRLKKEPKMGKKDFMSPYWTYALFCTPQVFDDLETHSIQGYEVWEVIIHPTNLPSNVVSQLSIPTITGPVLVAENEMEVQTCSQCRTTKHFPHKRGWMQLRRAGLDATVDIVQTVEWFGSGHSAYREILISNRFARLILDKGWKGVTLKATKLV